MNDKRGQLDALLDVGLVLADNGEDELCEGMRLGKYRLVRRLGAGGMGEVWDARDADLDRRIALKVLRADSGTARVRLVREARAMARLRHPNVITVFDAATIDGRDVIALELIEGETLASWLGRGRAPRDVLATLLAAGRGLAAAHAAGIIHRDFKPHNVLVERSGRVVVTDFGLARAVGDATVPPSPEPGALDHPLTLTGAVLGTPAYMAPEQLAGEPTDERADQFAFCVTLWEALTGARPFPGDTLEAIAAAIDAGAPQGGERVPRRLRPAIARGLDRDPGRRWPSIDALLDALVRVQRRPRRIAIALGAAAAIVLAAVAVHHELAPSAAVPWHAQVADLQAFEENSDGAAISPDGKQIAYVSDREQTDTFRAYIAPIAGGEARPITPAGETYLLPRWTRDGKAVLLVHWVGDGYRIARQPIDGGRIEDLGPGVGVDDCGDVLAIAETGTRTAQIVLQHPDGVRDPIVTASDGLWTPRCDATGQRIVFARGSATAHDPVDDLVITDRAGHQVQLTEGHATAGGVFTPDGRSVVFSALAAGQVYLYEVAVTGGTAHRLTSENGPHLSPDVAPDGKTVVFDRDVGGTLVIAGGTGAPRKLTARHETLLSLHVTRDGAFLIAGRLKEKGNELVVISTRDGTERTLAFGRDAFLSADDRRVLFAAVDGEPRLLSIPLEGGPITTLAKLPGELAAGADGPDGAHLEIARGNTSEAWHVTPRGSVEPEGVAGLVIPAPSGGWRVVRSFDTGWHFRFVAPGAPLTAPGYEVVSESPRPTWLDDHRLAYPAHGQIHIVDAVTETELATSPGPDWGERAVITADATRWYKLALVGHVTRHLLVNFGERPGRF